MDFTSANAGDRCPENVRDGACVSCVDARGCAPLYRPNRNLGCADDVRHGGTEPDVIEYLKTPPTKAKLQQLLAAMGIGVRALLREKDSPYAELGLAEAKWTDDELLDDVVQHPVLMNCGQRQGQTGTRGRGRSGLTARSKVGSDRPTARQRCRAVGCVYNGPFQSMVRALRYVKPFSLRYRERGLIPK